jgi:hypothetical protein
LLRKAATRRAWSSDALAGTMTRQRWPTAIVPGYSATAPPAAIEGGHA